MNSQEREIIAGIFKRLEQAADQPRDPEADRFIADKLRQQPYAPYAMAQSIYVQEEAMKSLNQQIEELRREVEHLRNQAPQSGGFLSSIFGGGGGRQQEPAFGRPGPQAGAGPQQGGPWGQQGGGPQQGGPWGQQGGYPQQGGFAAPQRQGSGFLGSALTTAAGVAGGMVVGNALMNAFSGSHAHSALGGLGPQDAGLGSALGGGSGFQSGSGNDADFQNASFDDADYGSDMGGDGGSDDWT